MDEQIVQQLTDNISKNPTCESYHIQKFFGDKPIEEYSFLRFMEEHKDGSITPGIIDKELIIILLNRIETNKIKYTNYNSPQLNNFYRELFIKTLSLMLSTFK